MEFEGRGLSQAEAAALTDRLRNEIFRIGTFRVLERSMMENILREQDFQLTGCTSDECLVEVGKLIGAQQIIGGSITKLDEFFIISSRLIDVESGELLQVADHNQAGSFIDLLDVGARSIAKAITRRSISPETEQIVVFDTETEENIEIKYGSRITRVDTKFFPTYYVNGQEIDFPLGLYSIIKQSGDSEAPGLMRKAMAIYWAGALTSSFAVIVDVFALLVVATASWDPSPDAGLNWEAVPIIVFFNYAGLKLISNSIKYANESVELHNNEIQLR